MNLTKNNVSSYSKTVTTHLVAEFSSSIFTGVINTPIICVFFYVPTLIGGYCGGFCLPFPVRGLLTRYLPVTLILVGKLTGFNTKPLESTMTNLSILDQQIRLHDGLYSLNDLHKSSGNLAKHQPNRFIRNDQTQGLIQEISNYPDMGSAIKTINGGKNKGTYVCQEIVCAYAMWISPKFYLSVIQNFFNNNHDSDEPYINKAARKQLNMYKRMILNLCSQEDEYFDLDVFKISHHEIKFSFQNEVMKIK